jgi:glycine/D-amino acid oxidase-like deaminating enzyme
VTSVSDPNAHIERTVSTQSSEAVDVAVIGGGVIGTSAAAYLAEAGRSVLLFERAEIASGASGRNSGAIQHPFDPPFATLHHESLALYTELSDQIDGFALPPLPRGLLLLSLDPEAVAAAADAIGASTPELQPAVIEDSALAQLEPKLAAGLWACRLETGYPVAPAAATWAFARRAERGGAKLITGTAAVPLIEAGRVVGVRAGAHTVLCDQVLVAAGPWTPTLIPGWSANPPIRPTWGVVIGTSLAEPPLHVLEELGIDRPRRAGPEVLFSLVTAGAVSSIGSTFLADEPDASSLSTELLSRGARFVPALAAARAESVRACARPVSFDGRPIIGPLPGVEGLFVCAGHGPWGISTGPASAQLVARQMLGLATERAEFSALRVPRPELNTEFA